ncbi:YhcN/YlaJ family sporulation lipoprotein [Halalkalibacter sp. APA_J-10(15)]|uniref:YhcN/YlaJ family sporulation lipoprotein n=1 Tax=Halalkalibacter sp. APA_J-10(15) TaxID=2933805 RepID=UPI001FF6454A|nr:YhcN/YlaJ family sporulation lipoprotein [Halalkalibacter sp. APA_J-10(15)]MCK0472735.1 YhcN/YlaJ family sporulation lipoprotein [Halalkalibacter sp. APA_J-10(15)]
MKTKQTILLIACLLIFSGCHLADDPQTMQRVQMDREITQQNHGTQPYNRMSVGDFNDYSYVRYNKHDVEPNGQQQEIIYVNREKLSDSITRLVLTNNDVEEAATLVTDQYALVAYTSTSEDRELTADQVKRSAISIVPHYYDVYISDNEHHFDEIERFQGLSANSNVQDSIEQTIELFKQSPQGNYDEEAD